MPDKSQIADRRRPEQLTERLRAKLAASKNVLVLGVGGGNDSVSTLLAQRQLAHDFDFMPKRISVAAMMPDVLEYHDMGSTAHPLVWLVRPESRRSVQGTFIHGFPEPMLAQHKAQFQIEEVFGISMRQGSVGVYLALSNLIRMEGFDLILACDVGGDFIAAPGNHDVLSPMMDAYALDALRHLNDGSRPSVVYCVFGLGTDGESSPEMLHEALQQVGDYYTGRFDAARLEDVARFYRETVEPHRYSRTADFTLREIQHAEPHPSTVRYRARFHTRPTKDQTVRYYGYFDHNFDTDHYGRYCLFDSLAGLHNPFAVQCTNGVDWFIKIHRVAKRINHELLGQAYTDANEMLNLEHSTNPCSLYFGTPSRQFTLEDRRSITADTLSSLRNSVFDFALVYDEDLQGQSTHGLHVEPISPALVLVGMAHDAILVERLRELD